MKEYDASKQMWDEVYADYATCDLSNEVLEVEPMFDDCLKLFSRYSKRVLDFGCGTGDILMQCNEYGYLKYGLGIDRSKKGIDYCEEMKQLNHYDNLHYQCGDTECLLTLPDHSFDGIILSNVLDVVPIEVCNLILHQARRILTKHGLLFIKLNPEADKSELDALGLHCIKDNLYESEEDHVLRLRNLNTKHWKKILEEHFELLRFLEFPYPWQDGLNRLFLMKKME